MSLAGHILDAALQLWKMLHKALQHPVLGHSTTILVVYKFVV